ncbi:GNAT family N-acetyltransferase [Saccharopolyspora sp. WRP15-2]|uniref:GNAT family N-acetyltransferase n=1 Tax=Saccharopolyspora oryzae TaxID=2997343 RepID=A0ABT4VAG8_9PSEU|nr:GNAT family N-acetyltransferase [Saccharopolyspora oryzae]MDA3630951.1 GNAT family N-acetyltransferase [Saccharopolyspora oryzae]
MVPFSAEIDRAAVATWPATTVERVDGWLLRHCELLNRKRSNSAVPPERGVDGIERVEEFYAARGAAAIVQVSRPDRRADLDAALAERGYRLTGPTEVMFAEAEPVVDACSAGEFDVRLEESTGPSWLAAVEAVGGTPEPSLDRLPRARFAIASRGGLPVGVGMFAESAGWCGIYGMATHPDWRGRGVATGVLRAGARWASELGARLFLQVEEDNPGARRLYAALGFRTAHHYHYRVR